MINKELQLVSIIASGIDPRDGSPLGTPKSQGLDKARRTYLNKLSEIAKKQAPLPPQTSGIQPPSSGIQTPSDRPPMHGKPWLDTHDAQLDSMWADGKNAAEIALVLGRGVGAIIARLVDVGKFADRDAAREANMQRTTPVQQGELPRVPG